MNISFSRIVLGTVAIAAITILGAWALDAFEGLGGGGAFALIIGIVASYAVGVGLMAAVFYSSRQHDQAAHDAARGEFRRQP
ncbi:hypothetical protein [Desertibaculum subflavum]|uniref:hypothetical protein n=1 Tax=Desertibaculum subflavum TaxID=2268458 RepID=UPI0034D29280